MNFTKLEKLNFSELKEHARKMGLKMKRDKKTLILDITEAFKEYEQYKTEKIDKYTKDKQLGDKGKEGTTYLVKTEGHEYAMKTFRKKKSSKTLLNEAELQKLASTSGVAPEVIDIDTVSKYIVMEKMDRHLIDSMKKQNGNLNKTQQKQIIKIFQKLDCIGVFHGDSNILNYMYKGRKLYIIDFGMAKLINNSLIQKLGTQTPNIDIMILGMVLKLKELKCPPSSYEHFLPYISESQKELFRL
jgi:tRNA A-37 threonylcarbamoyl transferase component Bud32